ncbi:predicted protein [Streptomyces sp. C]|nr:predicted protein [Streptomyces sp. C]
MNTGQEGAWTATVGTARPKHVHPRPAVRSDRAHHHRDRQSAPQALRDFGAVSVKHGAVLQPDTTWTPGRARDYFELLPPRAQDIVREALRGGRVSADALRLTARASTATPTA